MHKYTLSTADDFAFGQSKDGCTVNPLTLEFENEYTLKKKLGLSKLTH